MDTKKTKNQGRNIQTLIEIKQKHTENRAQQITKTLNTNEWADTEGQQQTGGNEPSIARPYEYK